MSKFAYSKSPEIPIHAAYIWAEGEALWLAINGTSIKLPPAGQFTTRPLPQGRTKLEVALNSILRARESTPSALIATMSHPIRAQVKSISQDVVDIWLKEDRAAKTKVKAEREAAAKALSELEANEYLERLGL